MDSTNKEELFRQFVEGMGVLSELSVLYFKACLNAGATMDEAKAMTEIFLKILLKDISNRSGGSES